MHYIVFDYQASMWSVKNHCGEVVAQRSSRIAAETVCDQCNNCVLAC